MESGSPLAVFGQTAFDEELKIQDMAYKGYQDRMKLNEQAKLFRYQGAVARAQAPKSSDLALGIMGTSFNALSQVGQAVMSAGSAGLNMKGK